MPRCTSTNKFASYDEPEAEINSSEMTGSTYTAEIRVVRPCAECGEEMAEYIFEVEGEVECPTCETECGGHYGTERDLPHEVLPSDKLPEEHPDYAMREVEFEIEADDNIDVSESGGGRYKKNLFQVSVTPSILCLCCNETFEAPQIESEAAAASYFEVLV